MLAAGRAYGFFRVNPRLIFCTPRERDRQIIIIAFIIGSALHGVSIPPILAAPRRPRRPQ